MSPEQDGCPFPTRSLAGKSVLFLGCASPIPRSAVPAPLPVYFGVFGVWSPVLFLVGIVILGRARHWPKCPINGMMAGSEGKRPSGVVSVSIHFSSGRSSRRSGSSMVVALASLRSVGVAARQSATAIGVVFITPAGSFVGSTEAVDIVVSICCSFKVAD